MPKILHASEEWLNLPLEKHDAHSEGGLAPVHILAACTSHAVWLCKLPGMHTPHMGLRLAGARFAGHVLALAWHVWYPGSDGDPQQYGALLLRAHWWKAPH